MYTSIRISALLAIAVWTTFSGSTFAEESINCFREYKRNCNVTLLMLSTFQSPEKMPSEHYLMENCRNLVQINQCLRRVKREKNCTHSRIEFIGEITEELCKEDSALRKNYKENSACLKENAKGLKDILSKARAIAGLFTFVTFPKNASEEIAVECTTNRYILEETTNSTERYCGEGAKKFTLEVLTRINHGDNINCPNNESLQSYKQRLDKLVSDLATDGNSSKSRSHLKNCFNTTVAKCKAGILIEISRQPLKYISHENYFKEDCKNLSQVQQCLSKDEDKCYIPWFLHDIKHGAEFIEKLCDDNSELKRDFEKNSDCLKENMETLQNIFNEAQYAVREFFDVMNYLEERGYEELGMFLFKTELCIYRNHTLEEVMNASNRYCGEGVQKLNYAALTTMPYLKDRFKCPEDEWNQFVMRFFKEYTAAKSQYESLADFAKQ